MQLYRKNRPTGIMVEDFEEDQDHIIVLESDKGWWKRYPKKHFSVR